MDEPRFVELWFEEPWLELLGCARLPSRGAAFGFGACAVFPCALESLPWFRAAGDSADSCDVRGGLSSL